ncbi:helix-turn-helix transcriptional regulator [Sphingomonas sp. Leaf4]|uniref:helix-turn-helix transcriptional regulator n=1 Tax=Sphingomonas sp. Leaf4 TaxID=2876553 RepID=UPI001E30321F|nr:helix-turn-helix transcriptional regulator [Sphingomonas sp. Leaf4]
MTRRKGELPLPVYLDTWTADHPVAKSIVRGTRWFDAWVMQKTTPLDTLSRRTGIPRNRLLTISGGDRVSLAELDALSRAWSVSAADLRQSVPPELVVP